MKKQSNRPSGLLKKATGVAAGFILLATLLPGTAAATTAANAVITNTATVNYDDTGGNPQTALTASVDVTVNLVTAHPTLSAPVDATTSSGVFLNYTYTIINNSNGPDTYNLTSAAVLGANVTSQTAVFRDPSDSIDITGVTIGATSVAVAALAGATVITVPNDGVSDASVNGIAAGDAVFIAGTVDVVASVVDNATGTSTITLTTGLAANASVGDQIGGLTTFILKTTPIATVNGSTYDITITANDGATAGAAPIDVTTTTVLVISLTVTKYVANVTAAVVGGTPFPAVGTLNTGLGAGGIVYYATGVTGNPGEVLEYVIVISNGAGAATASDIVISDPIPNFTSLTSNIALDPGTTVWSDVAITPDNGDFAESDGTSVFIYAGDGTAAGEGVDNVGAPGTGGRLAAGATTIGAFQVTITP